MGKVLSSQTSQQLKRPMKSIKHLFCAGLCILAWNASAQTPPADSEPSVNEAQQQKAYQDLVKLALENFDAKKYDEALAALEGAYRIQQNPAVLYNKARVQEAKGDLEEALATYEEFVGSPGVDLEYRRETLERIKVLRETLALQQPDEPEQPIVEKSEETSVNKALEPRPTKTRMTTTRKLGLGVLTGGGLALATGGAFGLLSLSKHGEMEEASDLDSRRKLAEDVETLGIVADILFVTGGAMAITGIILYAVGGSEEVQVAGVGITPTVSPNAASIQLSVGF